MRHDAPVDVGAIPAQLHGSPQAAQLLLLERGAGCVAEEQQCLPQPVSRLPVVRLREELRLVVGTARSLEVALARVRVGGWGQGQGRGWGWGEGEGER